MLYLVDTPTPFDPSGKVDLGRLRAHVLWLLAKGVEGFLPTTAVGELLYLSDREREAIHRTVLDAARTVPVYPCTWDPNPATTRYLSEAAAAEGASGVLLPPPLHHRLDSVAVGAWYRSVAADIRLPLLAEHDPGRHLSAIPEALYHQLRREGVLAGLVDRSGDAHRLTRLCAADPGAVFAGGEALMPDAATIHGLGGFVSALANLWPELCRRILSGREEQLRAALFDRIVHVHDAGDERAIKAELGMGFRAPLVAPPPEALERVPARER